MPSLLDPGDIWVYTDRGAWRRLALVVANLGRSGEIAEIRPGADDLAVSEEALRPDAVLLTFDRDFGKLVVKRHLTVPGVVLFRLRQQPPGIALPFLEQFFAAGLALRGYFTVASPGHLRQRPLLRFVGEAD